MGSIRDALQAALSGDEAPADAVVDDAAIAAATIDDAAPAGLEDDQDPQPKAEAGQPRAADGKFAPKDGAPAAAAPVEAKADQPETAKPTAQGPDDGQTIPVPSSLPPAVKAKFASLDPDVRQAFVKLEESAQTAKADWGKKAERLNRYDELMAPRRDYFAMRGIDEYQAVQTLFAAQDILDRDPRDGIRRLAQSYGVDLSELVPQTSPSPAAAHPGQPGYAPAPQAAQRSDPALQGLLQKVSTLEQALGAREQAEAQARTAEAIAEVNQFASKPENMYFANVREDVARRIESGAASTLAEAYEQAIWASPEIRPLLIQEQQQAAAKKAAADAAARQKAASSQRASGSITGAPTPGAKPPAGPVGSIRDTLQQAMQEHANTV